MPVRRRVLTCDHGADRAVSTHAARTLMGAAAARRADATVQSLAPRARACCHRMVRTRDRAALGRAGCAGARDLAAPSWCVPVLRAACWSGRSPSVGRSVCDSNQACLTASRPRCQRRGSRGSLLDVEVLRRPRWRWRPAHSATASRCARASSRKLGHLEATHRAFERLESRWRARCRAPEAVLEMSACAQLTAHDRAPKLPVCSIRFRFEGFGR